MTDTFGMMYVWSNSDLLNKIDGMINLTQTENAKHNLYFYIDQNTNTQTLDDFLDKFKRRVKREMFAECGNVSMVIGEFDEYMRCKIQLWVVSFVPFADGQARWQAQTKLYSILRDILDENQIKIQLPSMINVDPNH